MHLCLHRVHSRRPVGDDTAGVVVGGGLCSACGRDERRRLVDGPQPLRNARAGGLLGNWVISARHVSLENNAGRGDVFSRVRAPVELS